MALASSAMMVTFSDRQLDYSNTSETLSTMQVQRVQEEVLVTVQDDGYLELTNAGSVPIRIVEVRVLDDDGNIVSTQKTSVSISSSDSDQIQLALDDAHLHAILAKDHRILGD